MRITIRSLRDDPFFIEIDEQETIFGVKTAIFQMNGVFPSHQSIIYKGNILSNETPLPSLNFPINVQPSLFLVISKEQRERLKKEQEEKNKQDSDLLRDSPPKSDFFSSFSNPLGQGLGAQNNSCFDSIMKNITDKSPNFNHALNDKEALYESYDAFRDPGKRLELLKSIDRTLNLVESKAGCYRDIIQHQKLVTEAVDDAIDKYMHEINPSYYENLHKTVIPEKPLEEPSCEPIQMNLNQSDSFMDSLLQHQLMLVMTLPNGNQKLVKIKKNTDAVLKIMQLMMNLQTKSQKGKTKHDLHSQNKNGNQFFERTFGSNFSSKEQTNLFDIDNGTDNLLDNQSESDNNDNTNENENSSNSGLGNAMKQLEIENQMNLLKILMMSIVTDESKNNQDNDDKSKNSSFLNNNSEDEYDSESCESNFPMFSSWNKLLNNRPNKSKRSRFKFPKQPKYNQVFHCSQKKAPAQPLTPFLVDVDSESDMSSNPSSNFCLNSDSSNSEYHPFVDEDDDSFFDDDFFVKNNNSQSPPNAKEYAQPRMISQRNTTYYSSTSESIQKAKEKDDGESICCTFNYNEKNKKDSGTIYGEDETEQKRKKGWEIIYDIVNNSNKDNTDNKNPEEKDNLKTDDDFQNVFSNFNNDDDSSDISID